MALPPNQATLSPPPTRILVKEVNWLGDVVMSLPALRAVRRAFPQAHLSILIKQELASFFDGSTWIDGPTAVNLSGGLLCKGHPLGATGCTQAVDIIEQLRGTAPEGIQRKDAEVGISACRGGPGAVAAIHVYQRLEGE